MDTLCGWYQLFVRSGLLFLGSWISFQRCPINREAFHDRLAFRICSIFILTRSPIYAEGCVGRLGTRLLEVVSLDVSRSSMQIFQAVCLKQKGQDAIFLQSKVLPHTLLRESFMELLGLDVV